MRLKFMKYFNNLLEMCLCKIKIHFILQIFDSQSTAHKVAATLVRFINCLIDRGTVYELLLNRSAGACRKKLSYPNRRNSTRRHPFSRSIKVHPAKQFTFIYIYILYAGRLLFR